MTSLAEVPFKMIFMAQIPSCFLAYPAQPTSRAETLEHAVQKIRDGGVVSITSWRDLNVSGQYIIGTICEVIRAADIFIADITGLNPNVLFELGYAMAHRKRLWLLMDPDIERAKQEFEKFQLLTTIGYTPYSNSQDIVDAFYREEPYPTSEYILFDQLVNAAGPAAKKDALLYLKADINTEAVIRIARRVASGPMRSVVDDPTEVRIQPLSWYVQQSAVAFCVVCHFLSTEYKDWQLHNAKHALVAGLAYGLGKPLLMLAHEPYVSPLDYRDLLRTHPTAAAAESIFDNWLLPLVEQYESRLAQTALYQEERRAQLELRDIAIGDPVAEFESDYVADYFVPTAAYTEAFRSRHSIFVGRKGAGKTATLYKLAEELGSDPRNHICIIKPVDYELEGLVAMLRQELPRAEKGYLVESFWKFLLYTELTKSVYDQLLRRPTYYVRTPAETSLCEFVEQYRSLITPEFSVRLEAVVTRLREVPLSNSVETNRLKMSELLHAEMLSKLRALLGNVLATKARVVVLVDNLDKSWNQNTDLILLSELLFGLLSVSARVAEDFLRDASRRSAVNLLFTLFLRSDIHAAMLHFVRERDKLPVRRMLWSDPELLRRVVEERFIKMGAEVSAPDAIWDRYFPAMVNNLTTREYIVNVVLPKPRDLIYLVKACLQVAVNRGHARIEEKDILSAEQQYSRFALDSLLVEAEGRINRGEDLLLQFVQAPEILTEDWIASAVNAAGLPSTHIGDVITLLSELTFLGFETGPNRFEFLYDEQDAAKIEVLAKKTAAELSGGKRRFRIHPAFHRYLEIRSSKMTSPGQISMQL
jgi:hypothetical protein